MIGALKRPWATDAGLRSFTTKLLDKGGFDHKPPTLLLPAWHVICAWRVNTVSSAKGDLQMGPGRGPAELTMGALPVMARACASAPRMRPVKVAVGGTAAGCLLGGESKTTG